MSTTTTATAEPSGLAEARCPGGHDPEDGPAGQPVWCLDCEQRIGEALAPPRGHWAKLGIADLVARVAARRDGRLPEAAAPAARTARASGHASVSPGFDEVDWVSRWAAQLAVDVATALGQPPTADDDVVARQIPALEHSLAYLHRQLRRALCSEVAATVGLAVLREHRRLQRLAGEQDLRRRLRTPCPSCDTLGVIREDGCDRIECVTCLMTWSEDSFQRALRAQQHEHPPIPRARRHRAATTRTATSFGGRV